MIADGRQLRDEVTDAVNRREFDWPRERQFYLTLDLECDFGTALSENRYVAVESVDRLVERLEWLGVPVTCFVQTEVLDIAPESVESLRALDDVTFHPHSHTHSRRSEIDVEEDIEESTIRYREFFGSEPTGYRLPNGNVRAGDYRTLTDHGYAFDASLFPTWRPGHFDNTNAPTLPHYLPDHDLFELPLTVFSNIVRIPTELSYCRFLGRPFTWLLESRPPEVIVFNIHMHDLLTPPSYRDLPPLYKLVYGRNDGGFERLTQVLRTFDERGYSFDTLDVLYANLRDRL